MRRPTLLILFGCVTVATCARPKPVQDTRLHLQTPDAARYSDDSNFVERKRFILEGRRVGTECRYPNAGQMQDREVETTLEYDRVRCLELRAVGPLRFSSPSPFDRIEPGDSVRIRRGTTAAKKP